MNNRFKKAKRMEILPVYLFDEVVRLKNKALARDSSNDFARRLLEEAGVVVTPGIGFGRYGEGYFRAALTVGEARLEEAIERIKKVPF